ncbi:MAG: DNA helicase [Tannerellaceae bacterium]|nr:DNA helicase [Tannerellaceae bacterium]
MENRLLPQNPEAEKVVLGSIMGNHNVLSSIEMLLDDESFYYPLHKRIWQAIQTIDRRGDCPDMIAVMAELNKQPDPLDAFQFSQIGTSYSSNVYQHATHISELGKRRRFIQIMEVFLAQGYAKSRDLQELVAEVESQLKHLYIESQEHVHTLDEAMNNVLRQMEKNMTGEGELSGTATGFSELDEKSGGLQTSDLVVIAGDTSQGKTSFAVTLARNAAMKGASIAYYSLEMKKEQIAARIMSMQSGIAAHKILYAPLKPNQFEEVALGVTKLVGTKIYFDDRSTSSLDTILSSIRSMQKKYRIRGAVVDYLQILNVNMREASKEAQMAEAARRLKNLAKELDIWILALSQLNRDHSHQTPTLARLRDSGQIGEAADIVILIHRPEMYKKRYEGDKFEKVDPKGTALIHIAKGRNIGTHEFICGFDSETTRFYDLTGCELPFADLEEEIPF